LCPFAALGKRASPPDEGVRKENKRVSGETITVKFNFKIELARCLFRCTDVLLKP
jgi:hypothetical protein